jgi:hypothetical protein
VSALVTATYRRWNADLTAFTRVPLVAHVTQDAGCCGSELCVVWHESTMADMARLGFDGEEYVGAVEAIEARFWELEERACARESVKQRTEAA